MRHLGISIRSKLKLENVVKGCLVRKRSANTKYVYVKSCFQPATSRYYTVPLHLLLCKLDLMQTLLVFRYNTSTWTLKPNLKCNRIQ